MAGPFQLFRLKIDPKTKDPKGFGFCQYNDADIASSALRNLKKFEIKGRSLKADFASDNKNGNNLKREDVLYRDIGEITRQNPHSQALAAQTLSPESSSLDEMLESLSPEQEELLLITIREVFRRSNQAEQRQLKEALAQDERLLKAFKQMLIKMQSKH